MSTASTPQNRVMTDSKSKDSDSPLLTEKPRSWIVRFFDWLIEPHASITDPQERARARLITAIVLSNLIISAFVLVGLPIAFGVADQIDPFNMLVLFGDVMIYLVCRTRYFGLGGRALILLYIIFQFRTSAIVGGEIGPYILMFAVLPLIIASMWFSNRTLLLTLGTILALSIALPGLQQVLYPERPPLGSLLLTAILLIIATVFLLIFNIYRDRLERIRQKELAKALDSAYVANATLADANAQLDRANRLTRETVRLKSEFMSTMSHELRTPLNAIHGFCGIMLEGMGGEIDDDAKHMLQRIDANSTRLLGLINNVLDIAKIEAGRMELVNAPIVLADMVNRWRQQTGVLAEQKRLQFETRIDPTMPPAVIGDHERLSQIVINLLSNAFKFTHEGSITLEVKRADEMWQIIVTDTGIGIPPHALNYIFEEFRQVDGSSTRVYGGSGLGLSIVRNMLQMMNGNVKATSDLGKGSTFTVTLPLVTPSDQTREVNSLAPVAAAS